MTLPKVLVTLHSERHVLHVKTKTMKETQAAFGVELEKFHILMFPIINSYKNFNLWRPLYPYSLIELPKLSLSGNSEHTKFIKIIGEKNNTNLFTLWRKWKESGIKNLRKPNICNMSLIGNIMYTLYNFPINWVKLQINNTEVVNVL